MRFIVTGGSGFTGTYLCRALAARGARPLVFDLDPPPADMRQFVSFVQGDVRSREQLMQLDLGPEDVLFHFAARQFHGAVPYSGRDAWFAEVNVGGTAALIDAMAKGGTRQLVFFSTDMTYGIPSITPVPPDTAQNPIGPYGRSKRDAERLLITARETHGISATIFRPRLIAGAGRLGILVKLFELVRRNLPVPMIGSGRNRYQMVAVEDCIQAALKAVDHGCPPGPYNLGSGDPPIVRELLGTLIERANSRSILLPTPARAVQGTLRAIDVLGATLLYPEQFEIADADYVLDTTRTERELGWSPERSDSDIVFDAFQLYRAQLSGGARL